MTDKFILDGHLVVPEADLLAWGKWFQTGDRIVAKDIVGDVKVSTVFLGLDHGFGDSDVPILFETMIFGGPHSDYCERCSTWEQAEAMHATALALVRGES